MAFDKVVDSAQLDAALTTIANAIRDKNGATTSYSLSEMSDAINSLAVPTIRHSDISNDIKIKVAEIIQKVKAKYQMIVLFLLLPRTRTNLNRMPI